MIKRVFIILSILIVIFIPTSIIKISSESIPNIKVNYLFSEKPIGKLTINKIGINENLYKIDSPENTVEKHVTILKESTTPDENNSIMIIAAHSGEGKIAYFEELDKLRINDEITLIYNNKKYTYQVNEIWEEKKNGYININRENKKQLVLTTCSPTKKDYQLVVNSIEKEST